ncbi:drug/metabolite transporter (DMT)-like permease [Microbacterium sp. AK009]|uniref:EamA family transporter n=1 Tax=Microbacterium sp. AK009 TaxID=2723068 RepID=UPI0015CA443B|nr:DMT family transporter [Microbacterium sp. AK009]NYF16215.1 drug/metabolite transporter (DMT)-like permease [Microbacterium sp. AK009]
MTATAPLPVLSLGVPATASRTATTGLVMALASALAFSSSGPFMKPLLEAGWSLGAALLVRMGVAALVLSPALVVAVRRQRGFVRRHWRLVVAFGLMPVLGCQLLFFSAMQRMPVAVALLIQYLAPVLLVVAVWIRSRRRPSFLVLSGSVVAVVGLVLVVDVSGAAFDPIGVLFALGAAVCVCAYFVIAERAGDDLPPLALAAAGLLFGSLVMAALCVTRVLPFQAVAVTVTLAGADVMWWVPVLWVAAVATTVGYGLGVMAVPRIGSRVGSFVGLSEVLFALAFAWLFLSEVPAAVQFVGGALILVGVILVRLDAASTADARGVTATSPAVPAP